MTSRQRTGNLAHEQVLRASQFASVSLQTGGFFIHRPLSVFGECPSRSLMRVCLVHITSLLQAVCAGGGAAQAEGAGFGVPEVSSSEPWFSLLSSACLTGQLAVRNERHDTCEVPAASRHVWSVCGPSLLSPMAKFQIRSELKGSLL